MATALDRPTGGLSDDSKEVLREINTVRNYFIHGDARSSANRAAWLAGADLWEKVSVTFVGQLFQGLENLLEKARTLTGLAVPGATGSWVASDEFMSPAGPG